YFIEIKARDPYFKESNWSKHKISISQTEFAITNVQGGIAETKITIENNGEFTAKNITSTIRIKGGIFSGINITHTCSGCEDCSNSLQPGEYKTESSLGGGVIFGFGQISMNFSVMADNAKTFSLKKKGFVIGPLVLVN
ncbi:MAG: hypothetical protein V5A68_07375, partial [Candidatus Thermoplasmatota archaeon]